MRRTAPLGRLLGGLCGLHLFGARSTPTYVPDVRQDWRLVLSTQPHITDVSTWVRIQTECRQIHMTQRRQKDISKCNWCPQSYWLVANSPHQPHTHSSSTEDKDKNNVSVVVSVVNKACTFQHAPCKCFFPQYINIIDCSVTHRITITWRKKKKN